MKFRKKPVVIEATQWFKMGDHPHVEKWNDSECRINTLEGAMIVSPGDWIVKGVKGEFYPCKPDIFEATYEAAEPAPVQQEPVAWWNPTKDSVSTDPVHRHNKDCQPLYTSPPAQSQQEQEPVAWRFTGIAGLKRYMTQKHYDAQTPETKKWYEPFRCANCTTPPPASKPLTDEEIEELFWTEMDRRLLSFARAIEAAHGIKEKA